ncbi:NYN domain-containing protein, partial [Nocardia otitidiscaviarum]|nr:NYN domain-containing protein [Nocardia otitidiscaviarum]
MSVSEMTPEVSDVAEIMHGTPSAEVPGTPALGVSTPDVRRVLLVWDAPNLDMGLGAILG